MSSILHSCPAAEAVVGGDKVEGCGKVCRDFYMKKEAGILFNKALNSLILSIEHFNRPWDKGRTEAVLIFLDHSFEMLLKAAILHRGGKIREKRAKQTIGFDGCVRKALSDGTVKFLTNEQALSIQAINSLRDAAHHHILSF